MGAQEARRWLVNCFGSGRSAFFVARLESFPHYLIFSHFIEIRT
jgi:hypothetical protein